MLAPTPLFVMNIPVTLDELKLLLGFSEEDVTQFIFHALSGNDDLVPDTLKLTLYKATSIINQANIKVLESVTVNKEKFVVYGR